MSYCIRENSLGLNKFCGAELILKACVHCCNIKFIAPILFWNKNSYLI
jgi:hypothetical protein